MDENQETKQSQMPVEVAWFLLILALLFTFFSIWFILGELQIVPRLDTSTIEKFLPDEDTPKKRHR